MRQMSANTLQQVEKFKYLGPVLTSDGRRSEEVDTQVGKDNTVLHEFYRSVIKKTFKHRKAVSFQIGLCSDPYLWS